MLNRNMFEDKKDAEIARLKMAIEKFKEYDEKRKAFYARKLERLGELESYVQELDVETEVGKLKQTITKLKKEVALLSLKIQVRKIEDSRDAKELADVVSKDSLRKKNERLLAEVIKLRKEKFEWIQKERINE